VISVVACFAFGSVQAKFDESTVTKLEQIAVKAIQSDSSDIKALAQAGYVLEKLNRLNEKHSGDACAQVKELDLIKDSFHAGMAYEHFGCKKLKSQVKEFTEQVKNSSNYDDEEDYFYA